MKDSKYCNVSACCWGLRREILGLILIVIATILTIVTSSGLAILAMFLVGGAFCCCKHFSGHHHCHCGPHCHCESHCHTPEGECDPMFMEVEVKKPAKKSAAKVKK